MPVKRAFYEQQNYRSARAGLSSRHAQVLKLAAKYRSGSQIGRVLDLGCLDGTFSMMLGRQLAADEVCGVDISQANVESAQAKGCRAIVFDLDSGRLPFDDASFDFIHVGDVLEHLYNPDNLLEEIRRLLTAEGHCILTTPNLAALANRVALLFGYQPFPTGTSLEHDPGKLFVSNPLLLGGHIRVFTYRAISQLCRIHNLSIVKVVGMPMSLGGQTMGRVKVVRTLERVLLGRTLYRVFPGLAWDLLLVIRKLEFAMTILK